MMLSLSSVGALLIVLAMYSLGLALYRLTFHPLAKFPGPKKAAISRYYEAYHDAIKGGQYTFKIREMHKKYGPIVRISPYELHIHDPAFRNELYSNRGCWNKYDFAYKPFGAPRATFSSIDHFDRKERRAAVQPFFSKQGMVALEPVFFQNVQKLVARIKDCVTTRRVVDLNVVYTALTMDIITQYSMGSSMACLDREDFNEDLVLFFKDFGPLWTVGKHIPVLPWLFRRIPSWLIKRLNAKLATHKRFTEFCASKVREVVAEIQSAESKTTEHRTIFHEMLMVNGCPPSPQKQKDMVDEGEIILSGGAGTVSRPLQFLSYYFCQQPALLKRLRQELRDAECLGDLSTLKIQKLEHLPFLTAVITESIRLSHGVTTRLAQIAPDRAIDYGKWRIPAGTPVGMSNGMIFDDETYFPEPRSFIPDRWMDPESKKRLAPIFAPFSSGTRMCLGYNLVWSEFYLTVATICSTFDFELYDTIPEDVEYAGDAFIMKTKRNQDVRVIAKNADLSGL